MIGYRRMTILLWPNPATIQALACSDWGKPRNVSSADVPIVIWTGHLIQFCTDVGASGCPVCIVLCQTLQFGRTMTISKTRACPITLESGQRAVVKETYTDPEVSVCKASTCVYHSRYCCYYCYYYYYYYYCFCCCCCYYYYTGDRYAWPLLLHF